MMCTNKKQYSRQPTFEQLEDRRVLSTVTVSNATDDLNGNTANISALLNNPGTDGISLQEAIAAADNTFGHDTILFDLPPGEDTILLDSDYELFIAEGVTIDAEGQGITIDATGYASGVFFIQLTSAGAVTFRGLTIQGANSGTAGGGILLATDEADSLILEDLIVKDNHATLSGGKCPVCAKNTGVLESCTPEIAGYALAV